MIRLLIADDHAVVREGLKQIVSDTHDIIIADEASNGHEVLQKVQKMAQNDYSVIVLDISMQGMNGLDVLRQISNERPSLPVLILSVHPEEQYALRALKAGAFGYLTKESAPEELIEAIRRVSAGRKYLRSSLAEKLTFEFSVDAQRPLHDLLSDREYQVMCMIGSGKTVKAIADELCLSVKTISTYRCRILAKMNMKNNAELTRYVIQKDLRL